MQQLLYQNSPIYYTRTGEGPAIVLVHGFGEDGAIWNNQLPALKNYTVIVPHLPGSGPSALIPDMRMEGLAAVIPAILDAENLTDCILIGHSMGGYITLAFAEQWPQRLRGFGLWHSTAYADTAEKKKTREKGIAFIEKQGAAAFLETSIPGLFSAYTKEHHPELIAQQVAAGASFTNAALTAYYRSMLQRPDRTAILKNTDLPVFFLLGEEDTAVPLADGLQQCYLPTTSYVSIARKSGHMSMREQPEETTSQLLAYLQFVNRS